MPAPLLIIPILLAALYLLTLGGASFASPQKTRLFLASFASSASAHFVELFLRLIIGVALILHASRMKFPAVFTLFGWVLVVTTIALALLPWRWHCRFARWSVPLATRNMKLFALGSLALGLFILVALFTGH